MTLITVSGAGTLWQSRRVGSPNSPEALAETQVHRLLHLQVHSGRGALPLGRPQLRGGEGGGGAGRLHALHRALERSDRPLVSWYAGGSLFYGIMSERV